MHHQVIQLYETLIGLIGDETASAVEEHDGCPVLSLDISGIPILLKHMAAEEKSVRVYCRFGSVPDRDSSLVLQRLLEINLALAERGTGALGCNAVSKDVVFSFTVSLASTTGESLLQALRHAATQAARWRTDHFLSRVHHDTGLNPDELLLLA